MLRGVGVLYDFKGGASHPAGHILQRAVESEEERTTRIGRAWNYYYGQPPKPLKVEKDDPFDDNVILGNATVIVNVGVAFLFGQPIAFEFDPEAKDAIQPEDTPAEEFIKAVWGGMEKQALTLQKFALNGGVAGHSFVKLVLDNIPGDASGSVTDPAEISLILPDPNTVTPVCANDDHTKVLRYVIEYEGVNPYTKKPVRYRQTIRPVSDEGPEANAEDYEPDFSQGWLIIDEEAVEAQSYREVNRDHWPWDFPPIVDTQNLPDSGSYWGMADLEADVLDLCAAINFAASNINRILRFYAHPTQYTAGYAGTGAELATKPGEMVVFPSAEARILNVEMVSDLSSSMAFLDRLKDALAERTAVPRVAVEKMDSVGPIAGVALKILYWPLIRQTEAKRLLYGGAVSELNRRLAIIGGHGAPEVSRIQWFEPLPSDPNEDADLAQKWLALGVSKDTVLQKLGFDPDVEKKKRESSQEDEEEEPGGEGEE